MFKQAVLELSEGIMKQDHITKGTLKDLEKRLDMLVPELESDQGDVFFTEIN